MKLAVPASCLALAAAAVGVPLALVAGGPPDGGPTTQEAGPVPAADHHTHVRSRAATDALLRIQEAVGQRIVGEDAAAVDAGNVIAALDSAGISRAAVLSVAYFFGIPDVDFPDEREAVAAENDYVAEQVARHPDRLTGFFSVNPLAEYALEEIDRCADRPGMAGVKLHFANSDVDLRDPADLARLREVFRRLEGHGLAAVVHMRTRNPEYGRADAEAFLEEVLAEAPGVPVQIAHLAGWGGFDAATDSALQAFVDALERDPEGLGRRLWFDLAAVPIPPARAEGDSALLERVRTSNDRAARRLLEVGLDRVLYGTDWDALSLPGYVRAVRGLPVLEPAQIEDLLDDAAPWLR